MRVLVFIGFLIAYTIPCFAQLFEIAEDRGYSNEFNNIVSLNDSTLVLSGNNSLIDGYFSGAYIKAIDKDGNLLWEYLTPLNTEIRRFYKLLLLPNGNIAALGIEQWCCDCSSPFFQMHIISPNGQLLAQHNYESMEIYDPNLKATIVEEIMAVVVPSNDWPITYTLHAFGLDGIELWTYNIGENPIIHLVSQGSNFLLFDDNQMRAIDTNGMLVGFISYPFSPDRILNIDSSKTLVLSGGQVYEMDADLNVTPVLFESNLSDIEYWLKNGDFLYVIADGEIRKLNLNYEMVQCSFFDPLSYHNLQSAWCNEEFCAFAGNKNYSHESFDWIGSLSSGVIYSVKLDNLQLNFYPDADLRHLSIQSLSSDPAIPNIAGYVVNTGDITISRVRLNRFFGLSFCNPLFTYLELENIYIVPGDSLMFEMHVPLSDIGIGGEPLFSCCVFSSSPNGLSDRNETNDIACANSTIVGFNSYDRPQSIDLFPNPAIDKITLQFDFTAQISEYFIFDLLGRVVQSEGISNTSNPEIDIKNLESGSYFLQVQTNNHQFVTKFIKE